jgi:CHAT domain-containing protein
MKLLKRKTIPQSQKRVFIIALMAFLTMLCVVAPAGLAQLSATQRTEHQLISQASPTAQSLLDQGKVLYETGQFNQAAQLLQQAAQQYRSQGDDVREAIALSNLSLTNQQLGRWQEAAEAVQQSLNLLEPHRTTSTTQHLSVLAQTLNVQGRLQLAQNNAQQAWSTWERAATLYNQIGSSSGVVQSRIYQAQAMRSLGLYHRAIAILNGLRPALDTQADPLEQATIWRSLGDALRVSGELDCAPDATCAYTALNQSLMLAERSGNKQAIAAAQLSLGNTARLQAAQINTEIEDRAEVARAQTLRNNALDFYQQAVTTLPNSLIAAQAQLNQLSLLVETTRYTEAASLIPQIQTQLESLPPGRSTIDAQVSFARSLMRLNKVLNLSDPREEFSSLPSPLEITQLLQSAYKEAEALGDARSQAYVLGTLGTLYEQAQQYSEAQVFTQRALNLSQAIQASDIAYQWQWQSGRVYVAQNQAEEAIASYKGAFDTLQQLKGDLVSATPDAQFSFRQSVEPVYRELINLLLQPKGTEQPSQEHLKLARNVLESLQVAELENFFRQACLDKTSQVDQVVDQDDPTAAVVYPILLNNRLEVILKLPNQELYRYPYPHQFQRNELSEQIESLQIALQKAYTFQEVKQQSQKFYDWLVRPAEAALAEQNIKTLVFVLDGALRSIPMAALHDGNQYLIEKYGVAIILGLEIRNPKPLGNRSLNVLAASLTHPPENLREDLSGSFATLEFVEKEVETIAQSGVTITSLKDEQFTQAALEQALTTKEFQVVHLATHGQFGATRDNTFLLAADGEINVDTIGDVFRTRDQTRPDKIELLILSACETATGDDRDVLGIAGTAVRAGARSTIASLWSLDDESSVEFTKQFYQQLGKVSRAEAVKLAQQAMLDNPNYAHPRYWSPYILVGSWL